MNVNLYNKHETLTQGLMAAVAVVVMFVLIGVQPAQAWYEDVESTSGNTFTATEFDIHLNETELAESVGPGLTDEVDFSTSILPLGDSLDPQYTVDAEFQGGDSAFCDALTLHADWGDGSYDAGLLDFSSATTTYLGTWELDLELDSSASNFAHGAECNVDIVFAAWRDGVDSPQESGYTDEERVAVRVTADMVVLNEFLPRPSGEAYGFDFGNDHSDQPQGEWVELFNNSDEPADVSGWSIVDAADNTIPVTAANTAPATTTVPARGWLVVYMNTAVLNNTGDTVMLADTTDRIVDSYTYEGGDYCEREPTPEDENEPSADIGDCDNVPPNKSWARIPDGIGDFVDPVPTPGGVNTLDGEERTAEAFQFASELESEVKGAATSSATSSTKTASSTASTTDETDKSSASGSAGAGSGSVDDAADDDDETPMKEEDVEEDVATSSEEQEEEENDNTKDENESDDSQEDTEPESTENSQRKTEERKRGQEEEDENEDAVSESDGDNESDDKEADEEESEESQESEDTKEFLEKDNDENEESEADESDDNANEQESKETEEESSE